MEKKSIATFTCSACKLRFNVSRNADNNDIVKYDNHLYHTDCFKKLSKVTHKCTFCKKEISFESEQDSNLLLYNSKYYHVDCFKKWAVDTKKPSKIRLLALEHIDDYIAEGNNKAVEELKASKTSALQILDYKRAASDFFQNVFAESDMNKLIAEEFELQALGRIYIDILKPVYQGTNKKIGTAIPAEDLYEMWIKKKDDLRKINDNLLAKKSIITENLIRYDIAVLANKYNSFLKWKNEQKILAEQQQMNKQKSNMETIQSSRLVAAKQKTNKDKQHENELVNIVDDIF